MAKLEDLKPGLGVNGILPQQIVIVINVSWYGTTAVELIYKRADGETGSQCPGHPLLDTVSAAVAVPLMR